MEVFIGFIIFTSVVISAIGITYLAKIARTVEMKEKKYRKRARTVAEHDED